MIAGSSIVPAGRRQVRRLVLSVGAALALTLLAFPATAGAAAPDLSRVRVTTFEAPAAFDCGDFVVDGSWNLQLQTTTFYDASGAAIRVRFHGEYQGTLTNESTGRSVVDRGSFIQLLDLVRGTEAYIGVLRHVTVAGAGAIWLDVGRGVSDADGNVIFEVGVKDYDAGLAALCAYLRG
jgi:hypothetical protein